MDTIDEKRGGGLSRRDMLRILGGVVAANGLRCYVGSVGVDGAYGYCRNLAQVGLSLLRHRLRY